MGTLTFLPRLHTPDEDRTFIANVVLREQEVLVAESADAIVGFVALGPETVEQLYVDPARLRRGIGSVLLEEAKRRRPVGFRLWVFQQNEVARRFYEKHGLQVVELTDGAGNEEKTPDALYEWRPLSAGEGGGSARR